MENTESKLNEAEIARRKELFEYEMTEVLLNLKGEFSNFSKKTMPFDNEPDVPVVTIPDGNIAVDINAAEMPKIAETETHGAFFSGLADAAEVNVGINVPDTSAKVDFTAPDVKKVDVTAADTAVKNIAPETVEAVGKSAASVSIPEETKAMLSTVGVKPSVDVSGMELSAVKLDISCDTSVKKVENTLEGLVLDTAVQTSVSVPAASAPDALAEVKTAVEVKPVEVPEAAKVTPIAAAQQGEEISFNIPGIVASAKPVPELKEYKADPPKTAVKVPEHDISGAADGLSVSVDTEAVKVNDIGSIKLPGSDILGIKLPELHYKLTVPEMTDEVPDIQIAKPDLSALEYPDVPVFPDFTSDIKDIMSSVLAEQKG